MKTFYECSRSKTINILTIIGFVIILAFIAFTVWMILSHETTIVLGSIVILVLTVALFAPFFSLPHYIFSTDEGIGIRTLARTRFIPYSNIEHIERLDDIMLSNSIRLFGIGGMFGYFGWFYNATLGIFRAYITDNKKAFLIKCKQGKPIVFSVREPDEFLPYFLKGGQNNNNLK